MKKSFIVLFLINVLVSKNVIANIQVISLSPHTTEWMYELDAIESLVGISEFSDFPDAVKTLPNVANHNGIDLEKIIQINPDLILAWKGGNKAQDITRLKSMGFKVFESNPKQLLDIPREILLLGELLGKTELAQSIEETFKAELKTIKETYSKNQTLSVFYYVWSHPLMSVGQEAWPNTLLSICGAKNIFSDSTIEYPQVELESVIIAQPDLIIAANKAPLPKELAFWKPWLHALKIKNRHIKQVNPDLVHRFSSRTLLGLKQLCETIHSVE